MALTREDYTTVLDALGPPGRALPREADSRWQRLNAARAGTWVRVDARAEVLLDEADPRTTYELLPDWERVAGLPDPCISDEQTVGERRGALHRVLTATGGASRPYFVELAEALGFEIGIEDYIAHSVGAAVDQPMRGIEWRWAWTVRAPADTIRYHTVATGVNEPLAVWGNEQLECVISRLAPAHTIVQFAYGDAE